MPDQVIILIQVSSFAKLLHYESKTSTFIFIAGDFLGATVHLDRHQGYEEREEKITTVHAS